MKNFERRFMRTGATQSSKGEANAIFSLLHVDRSSTSKIELRLRKVSGIRNVTVDFVANTVLVSYDPDQITIQDIREFVEKADLHA
jgi:hypothetical protein